MRLGFVRLLVGLRLQVGLNGTGEAAKWGE
jgi:hypothetical protein